MGFKKEISPDDYDIFVSTLGNINTYTSYLALPMGVSVVLFSTEKKTGRKIWYYICLVMALTAMVMGVSDNAYLALFALLGLLPLYLFADRKGIQSYLVIISTFLTIILLLIKSKLYLETVYRK